MRILRRAEDAVVELERHDDVPVDGGFFSARVKAHLGVLLDERASEPRRRLAHEERRVAHHDASLVRVCAAAVGRRPKSPEADAAFIGLLDVRGAHPRVEPDVAVRAADAHERVAPLDHVHRELVLVLERDRGERLRRRRREERERHAPVHDGALRDDVRGLVVLGRLRRVDDRVARPAERDRLGSDEGRRDACDRDVGVRAEHLDRRARARPEVPGLGVHALGRGERAPVERGPTLETDVLLTAEHDARARVALSHLREAAPRHVHGGGLRDEERGRSSLARREHFEVHVDVFAAVVAPLARADDSTLARGRRRLGHRRGRKRCEAHRRNRRRRASNAQNNRENRPHEQTDKRLGWKFPVTGGAGATSSRRCAPSPRGSSTAGASA